MTMRKEALMVQNLQLLGFTAPQEMELDDASFDRPNENLLLHALHFLLEKLDTPATRELRYYWPAVTPQDKAKFKRVVHTALLELEKQRELPVGASQSSRINTGHGPRVVDLLWRLSTYVVKTTLARDFPANKLRAPPSVARADVSPAAALKAIKAQIAVKTHRFKQQCVTRSHVQDQWCNFATELTQHIQDVSALQKQIQEEQNCLDATTAHKVLPQQCHADRTAALQATEKAWQCVTATMDSAQFRRDQHVLQAAAQYTENQPELSAAKLRPRHEATTGQAMSVNLRDVVQDASKLIRSVRSRLDEGDFRAFAEMHDKLHAASVVESSSQQLATLSTMVQRLQQTLGKLKDANEQEARALAMEMAAQVKDAPNDAGDESKVLRLASRAMTLCPPTPALPPHEESKLVHSLKKVSMGEHGGQHPASRPHNALSEPGDATVRKLQYDDDMEGS